ncbi:MAG: hypothetical protein JXB05_29720 [Myxococcaceae bacterium]|nr:hypothetical protein [Myxococcaceae bacterium]
MGLAAREFEAAGFFEVLTTARTPGTVVHLPFEWIEPPRASRTHSKEKPPIVQLIFRKPWLFLKLVSGDIPEPEEH